MSTRGWLQKWVNPQRPSVKMPTYTEKNKWHIIITGTFPAGTAVEGEMYFYKYQFLLY